MAAAGRLFQSRMELGKKDAWWHVTLLEGRNSLWSWLLVLSGAGMMTPVVGTATRPSWILCIRVILAFDLRDCSESHDNVCIIWVGLLLRRQSPVTYLAALRWTPSTWLMRFLVGGSQTTEAYSKMGRTRAL